METKKSISCPACDSIEVVPAKRFCISATDAANHFVLSNSNSDRYSALVRHINYLWNDNRCELMRCASCELDFSNPFVAGDAAFYNLAAHADYPREKWEFRQTERVVKLMDTTGKRALEIGSGYGSFLKMVSPQCFERSAVVAVEYNEEACKRLSRSGYHVESADIRSDTFLKYDSTFDFVFMFQVLEHMDSLDALASRIQMITTDGAHIFIAVPNRHRILFNESHVSLLDVPPNHISMWSRRALECFGRKLGCLVQDFRTEPTSWRNFLMQDVVYSHMRRAQQPGSIANVIRSRPRTQTRRLLEAALAAVYIPARFPHWLDAATSQHSLGGSVWIHLTRTRQQLPPPRTPDPSLPV